MRKITILKGLPASGKSTWAKEIVSSSDGSIKRINKDDIRAMLDNSAWSKDNEQFVLKVRDDLIALALAEGKDVIVDDTNIHLKHEKRIRELFGHLADIEVKVFDTSLEECIFRNAGRDNPVPDEVIHRMDKQWNRCQVLQQKNLLPLVEKYIPNKSLDSAIVVDIDGTLARHVARGPYEWDKVLTDEVIRPVKDILYTYHTDYRQTKILLLSGRDSVCREDTITWLLRNYIDYNNLFMRTKGDTRPDTIVKLELFDTFIRNNYNVLFVIDDRKCMKRLWTSIGLFVFDVNQTDEYF